MNNGAHYLSVGRYRRIAEGRCERLTGRRTVAAPEASHGAEVTDLKLCGV